MADYINIRGQNIEVVASDPANPTQGQIWYNSTSNTLKGKGVSTASWATGGTMGSPRRKLAGAGTQTAGLAAAGFTPPTTATEEYNGTSWSPSGSVATARYGLGGAGTQTAGLIFGGFTGSIYVGSTEEYNGSTWAGGGNMGAARQVDQQGAGTQTAGIAVGGTPNGGGTLVASTEEYDGSAWTGGGNLPVAKDNVATSGTQTATLAFSGNNAGKLATTEEYNGTSWTASPAILSAAKTGTGAAGTQTAALCISGEEPTGNTNKTEIYDGISWSLSANVATARQALASCGTIAEALAFGGYSTVQTGATEEYSGAVPVTVTITAS